MPELSRFHLAFPVDDLQAARRFYGGLLGCSEGRTSSRWIDFDFFGHQLTAHLVERAPLAQAPGDEPSATRPVSADPVHPHPGSTNPVDGDQVPARHFGMILDRPQWEQLAARLEAAGADFLIRPRIRFEGQVGEQATLFIRDPAGHALEFKSFTDDRAVFAT